MPFSRDPRTLINRIPSASSSPLNNPSQIDHMKPTSPDLPTPTLPTNRTTRTASTLRSNAANSHRYPVARGPRSAKPMDDDPVRTMGPEDQRVLFEHLSMKDANGNYKSGSVQANGQTIVFDKSDVRCDESHARADVAAVFCDGKKIGGWEKDGDVLRWVYARKEQGTSKQGLQPSRLSEGRVLGHRNQEPTMERQTSPLSQEIASDTYRKQCTSINTTPTASNAAFIDSPQPLNVNNFTILKPQNHLGGLMSSASLTQSIKPALSTMSAKATCSYDRNTNQVAPAEWTVSSAHWTTAAAVSTTRAARAALAARAAVAARATMAATAATAAIAATAATAATTVTAAAAAGVREEALDYEYGDSKGKTLVTSGILNTIKDVVVPDWDFIDEVYATEEWNVIDMPDKVTLTPGVEGWFML